MNEILKEPTAEQRVVAYIRSECFQQDIGIIQNEYATEGKPIPPLSELKQEALSSFLAWLAVYEQCETRDHRWVETADAENGRSEMSCDRCGESHVFYW